MNAVSLRLDRIRLRPRAAKTPCALLARRHEGAVPASDWTPDEDPAPVIYAVNQWRSMARADIELTLSARADRNVDVWISAQPTEHSSRILGSLEPFRLRLAAGSRAARRVVVTLSGVELGSASIGRYLVEWEWLLADAPGGPTRAFARTKLVVYTTLRLPASPWTQDDSSEQDDLPWVDAVDWACRWAGGERSDRGVVKRITQSLDRLGGTTFTVAGVPTRFTYTAFPQFLTPDLDLFRLGPFLSLLSGNTTMAPARANCADLAAAVAVFANILGCPAKIRHLEAKDGGNFPVNPVRVFGLDEKESAPHIEAGFEYHRAAALVRGKATSIYDACLQLDFLGAPGSPPFCWSPAVGVAPTAPRAQGYMQRLVAGSAGPLQFTDAAIPSVKRSVTLTVDAVVVHRSERYTARIASSLTSDALAVPAVAPDSTAVLLARDDGWDTIGYGRLPSTSYLHRPAGVPDALLWVHVIDCGDRATAVSVASEILSSSSKAFAALPGSQPVTLVESSRGEALSVGDRHVVLAKSVGMRPVNAGAFASAMWRV